MAFYVQVPMHTLTCDSGRNMFGLHRHPNAFLLGNVDVQVSGPTTCNSANDILNLPRHVHDAIVDGVHNITKAHENAAIARNYRSDRVYMNEVANKVSDVNGRLDLILEKLNLIISRVHPAELRGPVVETDKKKSTLNPYHWF